MELRRAPWPSAMARATWGFPRPRLGPNRACLRFLSLSGRSPWKTEHHRALVMLAVELRGRRPWRVLRKLTPGHSEGMSGLAMVSSFSLFKRNRKPYTVAPYPLAPASFGPGQPWWPPCSGLPVSFWPVRHPLSLFFCFVFFFFSFNPTRSCAIQRSIIAHTPSGLILLKSPYSFRLSTHSSKRLLKNTFWP